MPIQMAGIRGPSLAVKEAATKHAAGHAAYAPIRGSQRCHLSHLPGACTRCPVPGVVPGLACPRLLTPARATAAPAVRLSAQHSQHRSLPHACLPRALSAAPAPTSSAAGSLWLGSQRVAAQPPQHQRAAARAGVGRRGRAGALAAGGGEQISAAPWPGATNCASRMSTAMTKLVCLLLSSSPPCGSWRVPPPQLGGARFSAGRRPPWRYPTESSRGLELCCKQEVLTLTMSSRGRAGLHRLLPSLESRPSYRRKVGLWRGV